MGAIPPSSPINRNNDNPNGLRRISERTGEPMPLLVLEPAAMGTNAAAQHLNEEPPMQAPTINITRVQGPVINPYVHPNLHRMPDGTMELRPSFFDPVIGSRRRPITDADIDRTLDRAEAAINGEPVPNGGMFTIDENNRITARAAIGRASSLDSLIGLHIETEEEEERRINDGLLRTEELRRQESFESRQARGAAFEDAMEVQRGELVAEEEAEYQAMGEDDDATGTTPDLEEEPFIAAEEPADEEEEEEEEEDEDEEESSLRDPSFANRREQAVNALFAQFIPLVLAGPYADVVVGNAPYFNALLEEGGVIDNTIGELIDMAEQAAIRAEAQRTLLMMLRRRIIINRVQGHRDVRDVRRKLFGTKKTDGKK